MDEDRVRAAEMAIDAMSQRALLHDMAACCAQWERLASRLKRDARTARNFLRATQAMRLALVLAEAPAYQADTR